MISRKKSVIQGETAIYGISVATLLIQKVTMNLFNFDNMIVYLQEVCRMRPLCFA